MKTIRIVTNFQGQASERSFTQASVVIGRANKVGKPDLNLAADINVSRRHARIEVEGDDCWIEDLGSTFGTKVNSREIKGQGKQPLKDNNIIELGDTMLKVSIEVPKPAELSPSDTGQDVKISETLDAHTSTSDLFEKMKGGVKEPWALLLELPVEFGAQSSAERLPAILRRIVKGIPGAERGALLLRCPRTDALLLNAFVSDGEPAVSETLARRAINEKKGFIWRRTFEGDLELSIQRFNIASGMYVPLLFHGKALGVICVDNPHHDSAFSNDDLRFLLAIAHQAAIAISNHQLQKELRDNAKLLERLLTHFSPKLRSELLDKARIGNLRPGGQRSEVTVLFSELRGFTSASAKMAASDVVEMLNDYLPALGQAVFKFDGTISRFAADGILAVFGSPEADSLQGEKAIHAALAMQHAMQEINARRRARGNTICEIGIGIHCGDVIHGFVGAADRLDFTVTGDAVNHAPRFCTQAKAGEILISYEVYQRVFNFIDSENNTILTKDSENLPAYTVKGIKGQVPGNGNSMIPAESLCAA